jgi:hypothetical protein
MRDHSYLLILAVNKWISSIWRRVLSLVNGTVLTDQVTRSAFGDNEPHPIMDKPSGKAPILNSKRPFGRLGIPFILWLYRNRQRARDQFFTG